MVRCPERLNWRNFPYIGGYACPAEVAASIYKRLGWVRDITGENQRSDVAKFDAMK